MTKTLALSLAFVAFLLGIGFGFSFTPEYAGLSLHGQSPMGSQTSGTLKDHQFINMMVAHHQKALGLAKAALAGSERTEVRDLASAVIAAKEKDIALLEAWKKEWFDDREKSKTPVVSLGSSDANFDLRFINSLEPKILEAIEMAKQLLGTSTSAELLTWAGELIRTQSEVLKTLRQWRQSWYILPLGATP